jgi:hypothetical protein
LPVTFHSNILHCSPASDERTTWTNLCQNVYTRVRIA